MNLNGSKMSEDAWKVTGWAPSAGGPRNHIEKLEYSAKQKLKYSAMLLFSFGVQHMLGEESALQARSLLGRHIARRK